MSKHRNHHGRRLRTMTWISPSGHLCRGDGPAVVRPEYDLPDITVEVGEYWATTNGLV